MQITQTLNFAEFIWFKKKKKHETQKFRLYVHNNNDLKTDNRHLKDHKK